jgi:hypothetical protein
MDTKKSMRLTVAGAAFAVLVVTPRESFAQG